MKILIAALLVASAPAFAVAQGQAVQSAGKAGISRSAQKAVEEVTPIDEDPGFDLSSADLELARHVYVGRMRCELGATVTVTPMRRAGFFIVRTKGHRFRMHPVASRTGAIRLEDTRRGAMWLQLGNKSMLMSQKLGQRLADECQSPEQVTHAEYLKKNPLPHLLDGHGPKHGRHHGPHHGRDAAPRPGQ